MLEEERDAHSSIGARYAHRHILKPKKTRLKPSGQNEKDFIRDHERTQRIWT